MTMALPFRLKAMVKRQNAIFLAHSPYNCLVLTGLNNCVAANRDIYIGVFSYPLREFCSIYFPLNLGQVLIGSFVKDKIT